MAVPERSMGLLKYEIADVKTGKVLKRGSLRLKPRDFVSKRRESGPLKVVEERISLGSHFTLSLINGPSSKAGFALTRGRDDQRAFSWDWFTVNGDRATKLQEGGELALRWDQRTGVIMRTDFLSDVSVRINRMSDAPGADPAWRIKILKGSTITWP